MTLAGWKKISSWSNDIATSKQCPTSLVTPCTRPQLMLVLTLTETSENDGCYLLGIFIDELRFKIDKLDSGGKPLGYR